MADADSIRAVNISGYTIEYESPSFGSGLWSTEMAWDQGLEGVAYEIAGTADSPLRVMAGPGTGKTFAMKRRVVRLLEEGVDPARILVVTFTRTAAADLVRELRDLGVPGCEDVVASTLHSFCFSLLSRREVFEFLNRVARPLVTFSTSGVLQFEGAPLLQDLDSPEEFGPKRERTKRLRAFEAAWARLQADEPGWPENAIDREFQDHLLNWLRFHNAMVVGELIPQALHYLRNNPAAPELGRYEHVMVDEYQDLNKAEQTLVDVISANHNRLIVGDRDQSIYSFKHAHPDGIVEFAATHPGTHDEVLDECRRCPRRVVAIADSLVRQNYPAGEPARLRPRAANAEGRVHIVQWNSLEAEAEGISAFVQHLINSGDSDPGDVLILTPRRLIGYSIRDSLVNANVATHSFYHEEMLESDAAQLAFCLLTLKVRPDDRVALRFWLGFGSPSWREGEYRRLREHCEHSGESPSEALTRVLAGELQLRGITGIAGRFRDLQDHLGALEPLAGAALIDYLFPGGQPELETIRDSALLLDPQIEAEDLLDALRTTVTQPEMPAAGEFVRIMSLHKSKGLTSKVVIVAGCLEGLIPTVDQDEPAAVRAAVLGEQRRLFYVAITRTTDILVISSAAAIDRATAFKMGARILGRGRVVAAIASRFIGELGPEAPDAIEGGNWREGGFR